ncbi:MAG TPA: thioredoxin domain-containing protein [Candidatus Paceibacterota bacterium]|nr:thioredoxin domain-containing protein [Candidatus Paceibacterota bacterium]
MNKGNQSLAIPLAIIFAGALVGFGIYWSGRPTPGAPVQTAVTAPSLDSIKPIQPTDHVLGNPNAKVVIIEYSDTECPYCKIFHSTLHQIVNDYNGQVAWVFRHFPVHQRSVKEGQALECAAELGGNNAFWQYVDKVFSTTNSNDSLDPALLPQFATAIGLDSAKFNDCLASDKYVSKINADRDAVVAAGAEGTPYSIVFAGSQKAPITQGALPYDAMKNIIDAALKNS